VCCRCGSSLNVITFIYSKRLCLSITKKYFRRCKLKRILVSQASRNLSQGKFVRLESLLDNTELRLCQFISECPTRKYLRDNKITLQQYLEFYKEETLAGVAGEKEVSYDIDAYDDEELFLLDLKSRYDDLTDEELVKELEEELENKELFNKKVTKLRSDYKQLEDTYKEEQQKEFNAQAETRYNQFVEQMVDVAVKTPDLYGIELEDDEKNNVLSYLLELDETGNSNFYKALDDPNNLYKAA